jgi:hypothetical protein
MTQTIAEVEGDEAIDNVIEEGNMADATKRILGIFPKGIGHAQLQSELRKIPLFDERLGKNPNYYYTMISRLKRRGDIVNYRKLLRLPQQPQQQPVAENETAAT